MGIAVVLYIVTLFVPKSTQSVDFTVLIIEWLGFLGFAGYWLVMTYVIGSVKEKIRKKRPEVRELPVRAPVANLVNLSVVDADEERLLEIT